MTVRHLAPIAVLVLAACTLAPTPFMNTFTFDVENRSSVDIVVSVASDVAAELPGFRAGDRGTIVLGLELPTNGIAIEIQAVGDRACELIASEHYPTPDPFTLLIDDGDEPGSVELSTGAGASLVPIPLPRNNLVGCGG